MLGFPLQQIEDVIERVSVISDEGAVLGGAGSWCEHFTNQGWSRNITNIAHTPASQGDPPFDFN